ncbi:hypothetical protein ABIB49_003426 [Arthrobacter sp. UYCu512]
MLAQRNTCRRSEGAVSIDDCGGCPVAQVILRANRGSKTTLTDVLRDAGRCGLLLAWECPLPTADVNWRWRSELEFGIKVGQ